VHYYKRDIGKYYKKAGRLSMLQHGAYTMLMDACYDREQFPTIEQAIDWCWASSTDEIDAVKFILSKFFTEYDGVFKQAHITEILEKYHENSATNKAIAIKREADRRTKRAQTVHEPPPNKELPITNQELRTKDQKKNPVVFNLPNWISGDTWKAFIEHRQKLKAPMTNHAKNLMVKKLGKLNGGADDILNQSISSGWKGIFEIKTENNNGQQTTTSRAKQHQDKLREIAERDIKQNGHTDSVG
jgi:uncharacterized protein YdaU (DUF1376 family)